MAAQTKKLKEIARRITKLRAQEQSAGSRFERWGLGFVRWFWMLYHEFIRDNVKIRAESLAYLSLFSLLPLLAGCFFIFTILAQFGMVQDAINGLLSTFLANIPIEHREFINDYILHFQKSYLSTIIQSSGNIGIFAIFILAYVGLQAFNNIESTLNDIWGSDITRPFLEKVRNFIVVAVVAPIVLIAGFSIPIILSKIPVTAFFLDNLPWLKVILNTLIPTGLLFITFAVLYRFVPVVQVTWKASIRGAAFATVALLVTNALLRVYFSFFTSTAYGKLAAVPLIAFWLFVVWMVVILGAEVSYLVENEEGLIVEPEASPTLGQTKSLVTLLITVHRNFKQGKGAAPIHKLFEATNLTGDSMKFILDFSMKQGWVCEASPCENFDEIRHFLPCRDLSHLKIADVVESFIQISEKTGSDKWNKSWNESLKEWLRSYGKQSIEDYTG